MTERSRKKANASARPIRNILERERVAEIVKELSDQTDRDSAAEKRLAALLREMEKYDNVEDDPGDDFLDESDYSGPRRRWSDQD
jgi:hypothetical protein